MYGDTSAPQLLQTRYRSGPLDMRDSQGYAAGDLRLDVYRNYGAEAATMSCKSSLKSRFASYTLRCR